jgi:hypothetical protein
MNIIATPMDSNKNILQNPFNKFIAYDKNIVSESIISKLSNKSNLLSILKFSFFNK